MFFLTVADLNSCFVFPVLLLLLFYGKGTVPISGCGACVCLYGVWCLVSLSVGGVP